MTLTRGLQIIRSRFFFNHSSPSERVITEEITLYNDSPDSSNFVIISLPDFREGLRVLDFDNSELAFYPKDIIRKELLAIKETNKDLYDRITDALENRHLLWIVFPEGRSIKPKELRVLKLVYYDREEIKYVSTFFNIPQFFQTKHKTPQENYDTFYFVKAPTNYELKFERTVGENLPEKVYEETRKSFISIRLPTSGTSYLYEFIYEVGLSKGERSKWMGLTIGLSILAISLTVIAPLEWVNRIVLGALGAAILTISTAMLALLSDPVTQKTKWILLIPMTLAIILITVSSSGTNTVNNVNITGK